MAGSYLPLAAILLATAATLLATTSAVQVAADEYSGRMVIIHAPGARVVSAGGALNTKWQQQRRLVEDEVAPELGGLLGAGDPRGIGYDALDQQHPVCLHNCGAPAPAPGRPITGKRSCESLYGCPHTPVAGHARAVHV